MSGADVARAIRSEPLLRASRLVMLTSAGTSGERADVARSLTKPVRRAALLETLADVLGDVEHARAGDRARRGGGAGARASSSSPRTTPSTSS